MKAFDWRAEPISRAITKSYRNTQNVRRCLTRECGDAFRFDRPFTAWLKDGREKTMGTQPTNGSGARLKSGKRSFS
ncbi:MULTISPECIES: DUF6434 domain-containing protein [Mesorhizobium]|uniref:DUF6434 domain-containing protein n=1 Tax=Mesorhizobium TaxID=68287 RepID=UPI0004253356|nr:MULTISPECIES: DUF6434 domain-containing protein [Mesorhizobium]WJI40905.1 DUF6434 domain-containing protein [Mesorhizobium opportunistum]